MSEEINGSDEPSLATVIVIANQKGGAGKSTTTMQLAGSLAKRGFRVMVADGDKQATSSRWVGLAEDGREMPVFVSNLASLKAKISREIGKVMTDYDYIIVDCPPDLDDGVTQAAMVIADLVIVPTRPSMADFWSSQDTASLIKTTRVLNESLKAVIFLNGVVSNAGTTKEAREMAPALGFPLMRASFGTRQAYPRSLAAGVSVLDLPGEAAAKVEVELFTDEVLEILEAPLVLDDEEE